MSCTSWFVRAAVFGGVASLVAQSARAEPCTYETWDWDVIQKRATNLHQVVKSRSELTAEEQGETPGCSVCAEDQEEIRIGTLPPFKACKRFRERIARALTRAQAEGFVISSVVAYRVGKSKGPLNAAGQRTQFSHHSYGTAVDVNAEKNGLYDSCVNWGPGCRLLRGGGYRPEVPGTITRDSALYRAFIAEGFRWGGEINGRQKDFMHFSLTGM